MDDEDALEMLAAFYAWMAEHKLYIRPNLSVFEAGWQARQKLEQDRLTADSGHEGK